MGAFRLSMLGGFELRDGAGTLVRLPTRKAEALLGFLVQSGGRECARDMLATLLWGSSAEQNARASLRQTLSLIGKVLGRGAIVADVRTVALARGMLECDTADFEACCASNTPDTMARAAQLYRGELLSGLPIDEEPFEEWLVAERERLRELAIDVLARLGSALAERGETDRAIQAVLRLLAIDPLEEVAHRTLMRLFASQGRRAAALRQYQICVGTLQRELGTSPGPETRRIYNDLLRDPQSRSRLESAADSADETPIFGRDTEFATLLDILDQACAGNGQVVVVKGEAGIGKTRLADELIRHAGEEAVALLKGRCFESQQLFPFAPWVEMFRGAGVSQDQELLDLLGTTWLPALACLLPELAASDAHDLEEPENRPGTAIMDAVSRVVAALADRDPLLLVLEDVHWADDLSLRLLAVLARRVRNLPVLILVTARDEELPAAPILKRSLREIEKEGLLTSLPLQPLSREDTASLVRMLARTGEDRAAQEQLIEQIWHSSEGNPFVVVESVRSLADRMYAKGAVSPLLPERVRDLIVEHIERLSQMARRMLSLAAVAARDFDFGVLQMASGLDDQQASEAIEELVRRRLLHVVGESFDFVHDRIRCVADEMLPAPNRRILHLALARALEYRCQGILETVFERLAYHYARSDDSAKAIQYMERSAIHAARAGAHMQAVAALDEALSRLSPLDSPAIQARRFDLVFRKTRSLLLLGRLKDVVDLLEPENARVSDNGDLRLAGAYHFRLGAAHVYLGSYGNAERHARRALDAAVACGDVATQGKAHFLLAFANFWHNPVVGTAHGEQAFQLLQDSDERWWLGQSCWILGLNLSYVGRLSEGLAMERRASELGEQLDDRRLRSSADWAVGFISALAGDLDTAVDSCRHAVALAPDPLTRMTTLGMLALVLVERHEPDSADALLDEAIPQTERFRFEQLHGLFLGFRGEAALQRGAAEAARNLVAQACEVLSAANYRYGLAWCQRIQGRIARQGGDLKAAVKYMDLAIEEFRAIGAVHETARSRLELGEWLAAEGEKESARAHLTDASARFQTHGPPPYRERALMLCQRLGT